MVPEVSFEACWLIGLTYINGFYRLLRNRLRTILLLCNSVQAKDASSLVN